MTTGFYRQVPAGTPGAEWAEGAGWIVHDVQAKRDGQAGARFVAKRFWTDAEQKALADLARARAELDRFNQQ